MNCKFCGKIQNDIYIIKRLYTSPYNLILGFNYHDQNKFHYNIEEYINLSELVERTDICSINYRLIGATFTEKNEDEKEDTIRTNLLINIKDLFQYLNELNNISEYDNEDDAKMKIISFIDIMSKAKN